MMTPWQLHRSLWTITLAHDELVAEGVIDDCDDEAWANFSADRFGWIMMNARNPRRCGGPSGGMTP